MRLVICTNRCPRRLADLAFPPCFSLQSATLWLLGWFVLGCMGLRAHAEPNPRQLEPIGLEQFLRRVLNYNETVQMHLLYYEAVNRMAVLCSV